MERRDFHALANAQYDILVVGGGIHGLATALAAARRGVSVALIDKADFAASTSFNHQRTAHGGLRSLQTGRLRHAREAILERRALAGMAPRLLRPLPFLVGTYRSLVRSRLALHAAFRIDAWLGRDRNVGVEPELHLPPARLVSRAATLKLFPGIRQEGLTGGANWYDYQMVLANRLSLAFAEGAAAHGARLVNYAAAIAAVKDHGKVAGMRVRDALSGEELEVRAKLTINAAGAHAGEIMRLFGVARELPLLKAMNLVTSKPASDMALAARGPSGAMLTLTPWHGRAMVGTFQSARVQQPSDLAVGPEEIDAMVAAANAAFPALRLTRDEVTLVHRGIVPAQQRRDGSAALLASPQIIDHDAEGSGGALTVVGVKYTTARATGAKAADAAIRRLGQPSLRPAREPIAVLPGAGIADHEALVIETARAAGLELSPAIVSHLTSVYGDRSAPIVRLMAERTDWRMPLVPGRPSVGAEVVHAIRHEMAITLADIVIRRMELGAMHHPGPELAAAAARIAADELAWPADRRAREIASIDAFYRGAGSPPSTAPPRPL
ncbi:MAG TPA: FAD-dependent oxidoreductase [Vicinamibacterales bacterium]